MPIFSWFYRADRGPDDTESVADEQQPLDSEDENVDDSQPVFFLPENLGSPEGQHVFYDDLVYYTVFYPCVLAYHKYVPSTVRRIIEFLFLLKVTGFRTAAAYTRPPTSNCRVTILVVSVTGVDGVLRAHLHAHLFLEIVPRLSGPS